MEKTVIKKPKERKAAEVKEVIMEEGDRRMDEVGERQDSKPVKEGVKVGVNAERILLFT